MESVGMDSNFPDKLVVCSARIVTFESSPENKFVEHPGKRYGGR